MTFFFFSADVYYYNTLVWFWIHTGFKICKYNRKKSECAVQVKVKSVQLRTLFYVHDLPFRCKFYNP